jgi:hypothetical protein
MVWNDFRCTYILFEIANDRRYSNYDNQKGGIFTYKNNTAFTTANISYNNVWKSKTG